MLVKLVFILALVGGSQPNIKAQAAAKPVTSPVERSETVTQSIPQSSNSKPKDDIEFSEPALWLQSCTAKLTQARGRTGEVVRFNNMGGNDVAFMLKKDPAEEIFNECMRAIPLVPDKISFSKEWLYARIAEMQRLPGTTWEFFWLRASSCRRCARISRPRL